MQKINENGRQRQKQERQQAIAQNANGRVKLDAFSFLCQEVDQATNQETPAQAETINIAELDFAADEQQSAENHADQQCGGHVVFLSDLGRVEASLGQHKEESLHYFGRLNTKFWMQQC